CTGRGPLAVPRLYHCVHRCRPQSDSVCCSTRTKLWTSAVHGYLVGRTTIPNQEAQLHCR
ncbi:hypothetical protein BG005_002420, partial [Podila minutissima]